MFSRFKKLKLHHQTIFGLFIALAAIIFSRGVRGLLDMYLYPNNLVLSMWLSVIIGLVILTATHYSVKNFS